MVRQRRWMLGITQQQLADQAGIKFQQIQKYESGANRVSSSRLWDIAHVLEVPVAFFFEGLEGHDSNAHKTRGDILTDKEALALVRTHYAIPEAQRQRLFDLAQVLGDTRVEQPAGPGIETAEILHLSVAPGVAGAH